MKVTTNQVSDFAPVEVKIKFEAQKELDMFCSLFNYTPITDAIESYIDGTFDQLRDCGGLSGRDAFDHLERRVGRA